MNYEVSIVRYYRTDIREHVCRSVSIIVTYNESENSGKYLEALEIL